MSDAELAALLADCLKVWGVPGRVSADEGGLRVHAGDLSCAVRRAGPERHPARWLLQTGERTRAGLPPAASRSIVGLLAALRGALGADAPGSRLHVADPGGPMTPVPVLLVTGFLGSGKTTLIRRILADPAFARSAVIVNEWGEIELDHELLTSADEGLIELSTGCLCCRMASDLGRTFAELATRGAGRYDRVLIETSGLADPVPILQSLLLDPAIRSGHRLLGTLTLVDARAGAATLARHPQARRQVAVADRLLITKTDLAPDLARLGACLNSLNPTAERLVAVRGAIAPARLFEPPRIGLPDRPAPPAPDALPPGARHGPDITSGVLFRERAVPALALILFLQALAEQCGPRLLRVKGLVDVAEMPGRPALVHGVQHSFEPPEWLAAWPGADRRTRLVFIGEGVPPHFPSRLLAAIEEEVLED